MITIQELGYDQLLTIMKESIDSFPKFKDEAFLVEYSKRLLCNAEFCVAQVDNNVVGIIAFYANRIPVAYISHIHVCPQYRKNGIGRNMLDVVKDYVKAKGFSKIQLEVRINNTTACRFYNSYGFIVLEKRIEKNLLNLDI